MSRNVIQFRVFANVLNFDFELRVSATQSFNLQLSDRELRKLQIKNRVIKEINI